MGPFCEVSCRGLKVAYLECLDKCPFCRGRESACSFQIFAQKREVSCARSWIVLRKKNAVDAGHPARGCCTVSAMSCSAVVFTLNPQCGCRAGAFLCRVQTVSLKSLRQKVPLCARKTVEPFPFYHKKGKKHRCFNKNTYICMQ